MPEFDLSGEYQDPHDQGRASADQLSGDEQAAAVDLVGDHSAHRHEQLGYGADDPDRADGERRLRDCRDEPGLGEHRQLVAGVRQPHRRPESAEGRMFKRRSSSVDRRPDHTPKLGRQAAGARAKRPDVLSKDLPPRRRRHRRWVAGRSAPPRGRGAHLGQYRQDAFKVRPGCSAGWTPRRIRGAPAVHRAPACVAKAGDVLIEDYLLRGSWAAFSSTSKNSRLPWIRGANSSPIAPSPMKAQSINTKESR